MQTQPHEVEARSIATRGPGSRNSTRSTPREGAGLTQSNGYHHRNAASSYQSKYRDLHSDLCLTLGSGRPYVQWSSSHTCRSYEMKVDLNERRSRRIL